MLTAGDVAKKFNVDPKTVTRWAHQIDPATGKPRLPSIKTPGGHHRFRESDILARMQDSADEDAQDTFVLQILHPRTGELLHEQVMLVRRGQHMKFDTSCVMIDTVGSHIIKLPVVVKRP